MEKLIREISLFELNICNLFKDKLFKLSIIFTFIFSMTANAFAYFNFIPQHDSLNHAFEFAGSWEISLGRFLLPLYGEFQGHITIPWIIGILNILFISVIVYLVCVILDFNTTWQILAVSSVLSANVCLTELTSVFMFTSAAYMLSVMFASFGVFFLLKSQNKFKYFFAALSFVISVGLYQAEIVFAVSLICIAAVNDFIGDIEFKAAFKKYITIIFTLLFSIVLYFVLYKVILNIYDIAARNSYNSLSALKDISVSLLISSVINCYKSFFSFFFGEGSFIGPIIVRVSNIILLAISLWCLINHIIQKRIRAHNIFFIFMILLLFPGIVCLLDIVMLNDNLSYYILYSLFTVYLLFLSIINRCTPTINREYVVELTKRIIILCFSVILFKNVIFSNQIYSYQKIMYGRTTSIMTRILEDVETDPEYEIGKTEVVLIGTLNSNKYIKKTLVINEDLPGTLQKNMRLRELVKRTTFDGGKLLSVTYGMTFDSFAYLLGSEINYASNSDITKEYKAMEEIINMPIYPKEGYCKIVDGRMVIKLSK